MSPPILKLNNGIMDYIYEFLDEKSKLNFAKAFTHWIDEKLSRFDLNATEQKCTSYNRSTCDCHLVIMFRPFFPNVQNFIFHSNWPEKVKKAFLKETSIESITFLNHIECAGAEENDILSFRNLPNLKKIKLLSTDLYSGKHLWNLEHIEELKWFGGCLLPESLIACLRYMSNLRVLQLNSNFSFIQNTFSSIIKYGQNLEQLEFASYSMHLPYDDLAKLPKLRSLTIEDNCNYDKHILLDGLANSPLKEKIEELILPQQYHKYEKVVSLMRLKSLIKLQINLDDVRLIGHLHDLEWLEVRSAAEGRDYDFLIVLQYCPKLKYLKTDYRFANPKQFVLDVIECLRRTRNPYQRPLQLCLRSHRSLDNIFETPEYKNSANYIKLKLFQN